jgi:hypothetical protein
MARVALSSLIMNASTEVAFDTAGSGCMTGSAFASGSVLAESSDGTVCA